MELEHIIGCNVKSNNISHFHPNGRDIVYAVGAQVIITDLGDPHNQRFLEGHDNFVTCVRLSHAGDFIASGQDGPNADIMVWDFKSGQQRFHFQEHDYGIQCLEFSHDDRLLISAGFIADKRVFVWNMENGLIQAWVEMLPNPTLHLQEGRFVKNIKRRETPLYQFAACGGTEINLWHCDHEAGSMTANIVQASDKTKREWTVCVFSKDYEYLYCGSTTGDIACVLMKNRVIQRYIPATSNISSIKTIVNVTSAVDEYLLVGGISGTVTLFRGDTPAEIMDTDQIRLDSSVLSMSLSNDQQEILVTTQWGSMYRIKTKKLAFTCPYQHPSGAVRACAFPFGQSEMFITCAEDGNVTMWDLNDYNSKVICTERNSAIPVCCAGSPDIIVAGYENGRIKSYEASEGEQLWHIDNAHKNGVSSLKLSKNMRFVVSGGAEGELRVWEIKTREMISHLKEHIAKVNQLELFTNDQFAITCSRDRCLLTWDLRAERRLTAHREKYGGLNSLAVAQDQTTVYTTGQEKTLTRWDLRQADSRGAVDTGEECFTMDLAHNDKQLVTAGTVVKLWDVRMLENGPLATGAGHSRPISCIRFAEDDRQVVTTSADHSILIWNIFE